MSIFVVSGNVEGDFVYVLECRWWLEWGRERKEIEGKVWLLLFGS